MEVQEDSGQSLTEAALLLPHVQLKHVQISLVKPTTFLANQQTQVCQHSQHSRSSDHNKSGQTGLF
jgi:hypothetical protein